MIIVSKNAQDYGLEDIAPDSPLSPTRRWSWRAPTSLALAANAVDRSDRGSEGVESGAVEADRAGRVSTADTAGNPRRAGAGIRGDSRE